MRRSWLPLFVLLFLAALTPSLYAQVADATGAPLPTPDPGGANEWGGALVWAFFSSSALEWLKRNAMLSAFSERTAWGVQRLVGILLSLAAALGVHSAFDPTAGVFTVTGLVIPSMWTIGTESLRQFVLQEITYRTAVKNYRKEGALIR
jgi:hypothetical protein